jgi:hypothetical protein
MKGEQSRRRFSNGFTSYRLREYGVGEGCWQRQRSFCDLITNLKTPGEEDGERDGTVSVLPHEKKCAEVSTCGHRFESPKDMQNLISSNAVLKGHKPNAVEQISPHPCLI